MVLIMSTYTTLLVSTKMLDDSEPPIEDHIIKGTESKYQPHENGLGHEYFFCMKQYGDHIAQIVVDNNEPDTFDSLLQRSVRTALKILSLKIQSTDLITICSRNHINSIVPFIASQFLGNTVAYLDPSQSLTDIVYLLGQLKPKLMFVSLDVLDIVENALRGNENFQTKLVVFGPSDNHQDFSEFLLPHPDETSFNPVVIDDNTRTAVVVFTSGTTGVPKIVCVSHASLMFRTVQALQYFRRGLACNLSNHYILGKTTTPAVCLDFSPLCYISSVVLLTRCLFTGEIRLVCNDFNAKLWWRIVEDYGVNFAFVAPGQAVEILEAVSESVEGTQLNLLMTGGAAVTEKLVNDLREVLPCSVMQTYSQTEMVGIVAAFNLSSRGDVKQLMAKPLSCGKAVPGVWYKVVDPVTERNLGPNQRGEIRFKSPYIMNGYYNKDLSTTLDSSGWFKSGDIGYYDDDHCFFIVDRIKEIFKYKNWNIVPAVLENLLTSHPGVKEAVVIGIPHGKDGEHPMGLVVLHKDAQVTEDELEKLVEEKVVDVQRLRAGVKIVQTLPKTHTGKIKRTTSKQMIVNSLPSSK